MKGSSSNRETVHLVNVLCSEGKGSETFLVTFLLKKVTVFQTAMASLFQPKGLKSMCTTFGYEIKRLSFQLMNATRPHMFLRDY